MDNYPTHRSRGQVSPGRALSARRYRYHALVMSSATPLHETIAAIATPPGTGGIGIVRLSGVKSLAIAEQLSQTELKSGKIQFRRFYDESGEALDHGLCLFFPAPHSFSGEDCVEIQAHGGPIVLDMLLERVCELGGSTGTCG